MIVKESNTKEKWCPMVRFSTSDEEPGYNRCYSNSIFPSGTFCIGSYCMMWRIQDPDAKTGYCGLAGKPQFNDIS